MILVSLESLFKLTRRTPAMAGNDQGKAQKQRERVGPSVDTGKASRVSKAAGSIGSQGVRVEQRSNAPATKQRASAQATAKRGQRGQRASKQTPKKGPSPQRSNAPASPPADSRVINGIRR